MCVVKEIVVHPLSVYRRSVVATRKVETSAGEGCVGNENCGAPVNDALVGYGNNIVCCAKTRHRGEGTYLAALAHKYHMA